MHKLKLSIDTSQFSQMDWKRLTDYVATLIIIDQKNQKKHQAITKERLSNERIYN